MNKSRTLILAGGLMLAPGAQAAVVANLSAIVDWDSLNITGVAMSPTSVTYMGNTFSSSEDVFLDYGFPPTMDEVNSLNGVDVSVSYNAPDGSMNLTGEYNATSNDTVGQGSINNSNLTDQSGFAGAYRNRFFTAATDGTVTFSIDYQLIGSMSIDQASYFEDYEAGYAVYEFLWEAFDATAVLAGDPTPFGTEDMLQGDALLVYFGCESSIDLPCMPSINQTGTLTMSFDVTGGNVYGFGAEGNIWIGSSISAVPVPAAAWLFGSGLIGLIGVARTKK